MGGSKSIGGGGGGGGGGEGMAGAGGGGGMGGASGISGTASVFTSDNSLRSGNSGNSDNSGKSDVGIAFIGTGTTGDVTADGAIDPSSNIENCTSPAMPGKCGKSSGMSSSGTYCDRKLKVNKNISMIILIQLKQRPVVVLGHKV